ncbi:DUF2141 domain-containing protein [Cellvibrio sp. pealriver]|uniref:DUF2141 domain-containing protein n=1 Tax=Cellvibrio sp. pealriver TaxID=1622269 RepID=UPI00069FDEF3|nr:DUF2141 domain-containing protein [Cellvibrio sp. pealriver]
MRLINKLAGAGLLVCALPAMAHELVVNVGNIASTDGHLLVAVYNQQTHYDNNSQRVAVQKVKMTGDSMRVVLGDLPAGEYAVKLFQDENDNGSIDMNAMGIPTEPYGFSNNGGMFGPPSFDDAKIQLNQPTEIEIQLR